MGFIFDFVLLSDPLLDFRGVVVFAVVVFARTVVVFAVAVAGRGLRELDERIEIFADLGFFCDITK